MARDPYLVTVIKVIADLEAKDTLTPDEALRLDQHRRWLGEHYPDVSAALAREYLTMRTTDEDRIRDAMAEAQDHPGRVITR